MDTNQVFNKINDILSDAMSNVVSDEEMRYNKNAQDSCANEIEECYQILKNADLSSTGTNGAPSSSITQGNFDMVKIKNVIEKCIKENSNSLGDGHVNKRLNNIDEKLDELATKITGHPLHTTTPISNDVSNITENNKNELEKIRNDMLEEFREIKDKMIQVLEKKHNVFNEKEVDTVVIPTTNAITSNTTNDNTKYQDLVNETSLLKDRFENFANKADYTNHTNDLILQRMSLLNEKLNQQQTQTGMNMYGSPSPQQLGLYDNNNIPNNSNNETTNNPTVMNKLKKEIEKIIETTTAKAKKNEEENDNDDVKKIEKEKEKENENKKEETKKKENEKGEEIEKKENPEKRIKELKKNNKFVFTKTKDPFKHIYNDTNGEVFKKVEMSGGGSESKASKLKEMRRNAIKIKIKN